MPLTLNFRIVCLLAILVTYSALPSALMAQSRYVEEGIASFYHDKFVGRRTANGEIFSQSAMTAAHKSLQLGTWVRVTNLSNNESVVLRINDRMPKSNKRSIDLTYSAAEKLGYIAKGLTRVRIEVIDPPELTVASPDPGPPSLESITPVPCHACITFHGAEKELEKPLLNVINEEVTEKRRRF
jgi:rare lipoprotein A